ncbi:uncharacterized protein LOC126697164 [Quercus robur]|uniref:uncharacterized protein LOC126697164 n=1 Tax=Quercus robur TaxID=38942 RepID=UPI002161A7DE|nr:uncharacterized protein LOC126697164 [Quercus robur]
MEDQCSPLSWEFSYHEEGMEELRHSLLYTTFELETTLLAAKEEITKREYELIHVKDLLSRTIKERDEAESRCKNLMLEKFMLQEQLQQKQQQQQLQLQQQRQQQQQQQQLQLQQQQQQTASNNEDDSKGTDSSKHFASSDSDENIISSPGTDPILQPPLPQPLPSQATLKLVPKRPLPEKGKLLQAVIEAGPLLKNLLLAGPLPQWQHPPPQLNSIEIPPVAISSPTPRLLQQDSCINFNGGFNSKSNSL